ncbi:MAG: cytochrome P450 [Mycobacterium sp.]|nr:cytochrome P450 [Mycobacterium sp.]
MGSMPPGPPLPASVQTALMLRWWSACAFACQRRYGDVFTVRPAGFGPGVYLADPEHIKTVFAGDPRVYHAGEANSVLAGMLGRSSVLVLDEDLHRDRRRLMLAPFHRDAVARQSGLIAAIAAANIDRWPVGREFPVAPKMSEITLEVILRTAIGASDPDRLAALRALMPRLLSLGYVDTLAIARPRLQRRWPWRGLGRRIAEADALLYAEIAERRADPNLAERTDALAMLVRAAGQQDGGDGRQMTDAELRDQLMTLLLAGHDTTATALSWALERLTRHPDVLARAVAAADAGDDEYLDAVARETLRIRPVVFDVGRVLKQPVEIAGYRLPAGVTVIPAIGLVHASAAVYRNPEAFRPERMLGHSQTPTTWLPFGGGNRRCLGANLALAEMRIVLGEVLRRVELETATGRGERPRVSGVIQQPHRGARIRVRALRPAHSRSVAATS